MSNAISGLFGSNATTKALERQIGQQQSNATSQQGQQLAMLSKQQGVTDEEAAQLNKPGLGRAMLAFSPRGAGASTLGG